MVPRSVSGARAGGALARGYDFAQKFDVSVCVEVEYGASVHSSRFVTIIVFRFRTH